MLLDGSEHVVQVLKVFLKHLAEDQQVIQINEEDFKQLLAEKTARSAGKLQKLRTCQKGDVRTETTQTAWWTLSCVCQLRPLQSGCILMSGPG